MTRRTGRYGIGLALVGLMMGAWLGLWAQMPAEQLPRDEEALYQYAFQSYNQGRYAQAQLAFEKFRDDFPKSSKLENVLYQLGFCYQYQQKYQQARTTWESLLPLLLKNPNPSVHPGACQYQIAESYYRAGDKTSALREYKKILKDPVYKSYKYNVIRRIWDILDKRLELYVLKTFIPGEEPSLFVQGHNIERVLFRAYRVNIPQVLQRLEQSKGPVHRYDLDIISLAQPADLTLVKQWDEKINLRGRGWEGKNIKVPVKDSGLYLVEAKVEEDIVLQAPLIVTQLGLIVKSAPGRLLAFATDRKDGKPLQGVSIKVFDQQEKRVITGATNEDGLFISTEIKDNNAPIFGLKENELGLAWTDSYARGQEIKHYLYTDRPIYRPNQTVYFKGIFRNEKDNNFQCLAYQDVTVEIRDPKGNIVYKENLKTNEFGTLQGSMKLTDEPPLGTYHIQTYTGGPGQFRVEEYRKPEYKVEITSVGGPFLNGDELTARIKAEYYFGSPLQEAEVKYTIYQARYHHYYSWGYDPYEWYYEVNEDRRGRSRHREWYGPGAQVHQGSGRLNQQGELTIKYQTPKLNDDCRYTIVAEVTDKSRRTVSGNTSIRVSQAEFNLFIRVSRYVYTPGEEIEVKVKAMDIENKPVEDLSLNLVAAKTEWRDNQEQAQPLYTQNIGTDVTGSATWKFTPDKEGYFRISASTKDRKGHEVKAQYYVWVASRTWSSSFMNFTDLDLILDKTSYQPGETAKIMITSQHQDPYILLTYERETITEAKVIHLKGHTQLIEIPIKTEHAPNFFISVTSVKDNQILQRQQAVIVPPTDKFITVKITPDKKQYRPRETAKYLVQTLDATGKPIKTEFSLGLVDESIYAIQEELAPDIRKFYYGQKHNQVNTTDSFHFWAEGQYGEERELLLQEGNVGMQPPTAPLFEAETGDFTAGKAKGESRGGYAATEIRAYFPDTMFWSAQGVTDDRGEARLEVLVPDSLTTWRATARAITTDTRVGVSTAPIIVRKDLLVRLETPRFFTQKDEVTISAIIHNYLNQNKKVKVILEPENVRVVTGKPEQEILVQPSKEERVNWQVSIEEVGEAKLLVKALTDEASDAMQLTIPIIPHGARRYLAQTGMVDKEVVEKVTIPREANRKTAALKVIVSPSIASTVIDALDYLAGYPYGCVEQTMSRFLPTVVTVQTLQSLGMVYDKFNTELPKMVSAGLQRLYSFQHHDGGWGWWEHDQTHPMMTAYVIYGLTQAQLAGFSIDTNVLSRGVQSLKQQLGSPQADLNTRAYMLYALSGAGAIDKKILDQLYQNRHQLNNYTQALVASVLWDAGEKEKAVSMVRVLEDSAKTTATACWWETQVSGHGSWTDDHMEATAYILKSILKIDPKSESIPKVVRWLAQKRQGNHWVSTKQTAAAVYALCDYLVVTKELKADYRLKVYLNGEPVKEADVNYQNLLKFEGTLEFPWHQLGSGNNEVKITKEGQGNLYYSVYLTYYTSEEDIKASQGGITIARSYRIQHKDAWTPLVGNQPVKSGDEVEVTLTIAADNDYEYLMIEDPLPAGCEVIREDQEYRRNHWDWRWGYWYARREVRDEKLAIGVTYLPKGTQTVTYRLRAETPGNYHVMPSSVWNMYLPEMGGSSAESRLIITD